MSKEVKRKLIHLSSLWIVACIFWLQWWQSSAIFFALFVFLLAFDWLRYKSLLPAVIASSLQPFLRLKESLGFCLTGATWMLLAAFVCVSLFEQYIAFSAILVLVISDSSAALVGKAWGSVTLFEKSLQGTLAFVVSAWLCLAFVGWLYGFGVGWYLWSIVTAFITALAELFSNRFRLDDNMFIPLSLAVVLKVLSYIAGFNE